jgi:hypothetical protein
MRSTSHAGMAALNDQFRRTGSGGQIVTTPAIRALNAAEWKEMLRRIMRFNDFTPDNDPYGEHDFGAVEISGERVFWKIDYYDKSLEYSSEDPADPEQTMRVMTIMLASEY